MKEARVKRLRTAMKEASKKRHMSHHNIAVLGKCRARKAFGKGIRNHEMRVKRYKLHDASVSQQYKARDYNEHACRCVGKIYDARD